MGVYMIKTSEGFTLVKRLLTNCLHSTTKYIEFDMRCVLLFLSHVMCYSFYHCITNREMFTHVQVLANKSFTW